MDPAGGEYRSLKVDDFGAAWSGVAVIAAPDAGYSARKYGKSSLSRIAHLLNTNRLLILELLCGSMIGAALGLSMSFYVQKLIDYVIPESNLRFLTVLSAAMLLAILIRTLISWLQFKTSTKLVQRIDVSLILGYYNHLLKLPQSFYDTMRVGEMASRVSDALQIRSFVTSVITAIVINPALIIFATVALFFYSWPLAIIGLLQLPIQLAVYFYMNRVNKKYQRRLKELGADLGSHLVETLQTISTIRRFSAEGSAAERLERAFVRLMRASWKAAQEGVYGALFSTVGGQLFSLVFLWTGVILVTGRNLSTGQLMSAYTMVMMLSSAIGSLVGISSNYQNALIAADRLFEILDLEVEENEGQLSADIQPSQRIVIKAITIKYVGRLPALREFSAVLEPESITVITGNSGCGKSSLLAALQKIYPIQSGVIQIGLIDISYLGMDAIRRYFSVLPQKVELISGSLIENICLGAREIEVNRVISICQELGMMEFIDSTPRKMMTNLSENGGGLSGGQRQRVGIARCFYKIAPVYILDEPTAGLDAASIEKLVKYIYKLKAMKFTVVIATHSTELFGDVDRVIRMEEPAMRNSFNDCSISLPESI